MWVTNVSPVAEELHEFATAQSGTWKGAVQRGIENSMWNVGMIGQLQQGISHSADTLPIAEAGEYWEDVTGYLWTQWESGQHAKRN